MTGTCFLCQIRTALQRIKTGAHGWRWVCKDCADCYN